MPINIISLTKIKSLHLVTKKQGGKERKKKREKKDVQSKSAEDRFQESPLVQVNEGPN